MALYIPQSRRRRNTLLIALGTLLVGLVVGFVVGRSSAITATEAAKDVHQRGETLATRVEALTIEYEQAVSGQGDTIQAGVLDALDGIDSDLDKLIADAPWLGSVQIDTLHGATAEVRTAATQQVSPDDFSATAASAAKTIRDTFGVDE